MKNVKKIAFLIALISGITTMNAQLSVGGGVGYNEKISGPGIVVKAEYGIVKDISISPSVSYFTGSKLYGYKRNLLAVDVNGHYKIEIITDKLHAYPLAGLNYSSYATGGYYSDYFNNGSIKGNSVGLNIGGGGRWKFSDKLSAFSELKYVASNYGQVVLAAGVLYEFK